jgi:hypothetical protein
MGQGRHHLNLGRGILSVIEIGRRLETERMGVFLEPQIIEMEV